MTECDLCGKYDHDTPESPCAEIISLRAQLAKAEALNAEIQERVSYRIFEDVLPDGRRRTRFLKPEDWRTALIEHDAEVKPCRCNANKTPCDSCEDAQYPADVEPARISKPEGEAKP